MHLPVAYLPPFQLVLHILTKELVMMHIFTIFFYLETAVIGKPESHQGLEMIEFISSDE